MCQLTNLELENACPTNSNYTNQWRFKSQTSIYITHSPTGNCQIYTIANANYILGYDNTLEIFKTIQKRANKAQMLIDINQSYIPRLEAIFKPEDIVFKQSYTSTNGSNMIIYLIKTFKLN